MTDTGKELRIIIGETELTCYFYGIDYREYHAGIEYELHAAYSQRAEYSATAPRKMERDVFWSLYSNKELDSAVRHAESGDTVYINYIPLEK